MLVAPGKFVFVHIPKTGGMWVREVLKHTVPEWQLRDTKVAHDGVLNLPDEDKLLPSFAFVRNPFAWYVSLFSMWQNTYLGGRANAKEGKGNWGGRGPETEYEQMWGEVLEGLPMGPEGFQAAIRKGVLLPPVGESFNNFMGGAVVSPYATFSDTLRRMVGVGTRLLKYENLRLELEKTLVDFVGVLPERLASRIRSTPVKHDSAHGDFALYYLGARDIVDRVRYHDLDVLEAFEYAA